VANPRNVSELTPKRLQRGMSSVCAVNRGVELTLMTTSHAVVRNRQKMIVSVRDIGILGLCTD